MSVFKAQFDQRGESTIPGSGVSKWVRITDIDMDGTEDGDAPNLTTILNNRQHFEIGADRGHEGSAVMLRVGYNPATTSVTTPPIVNLWGRASVGGVVTEHEIIPDSGGQVQLTIPLDLLTDHDEGGLAWTKSIGPIDTLNNNQLIATLKDAIVTDADDSVVVLEMKAV